MGSILFSFKFIRMILQNKIQQDQIIIPKYSRKTETFGKRIYRKPFILRIASK